MTDVRTTLGLAIEKLDEILDTVPTYENGRWLRNGGWGCRAPPAGRP